VCGFFLFYFGISFVTLERRKFKQE